jgi:hypothetical protein
MSLKPTLPSSLLALSSKVPIGTSVCIIYDPMNYTVVQRTPFCQPELIYTQSPISQKPSKVIYGNHHDYSKCLMANFLAQSEVPEYSYSL